MASVIVAPTQGKYSTGPAGVVKLAGLLIVFVGHVTPVKGGAMSTGVEPSGGMVEKVKQILTADEAIQFIVSQQAIAGLKPDAVVLTNKRFILYHPGLFGVKFEDALWRDLVDVKLSEGLIGATLSFATATQKWAIDRLPKNEARRAYALAQEREQEAAEIRRQRQMQEDQAKAGHFVVGGMPQAAGATSATADDPMAKLTKVKAMLDAGLITQEEFDKKKADILAAM
jgi:hypothetical protein